MQSLIMLLILGIYFIFGLPFAMLSLSLHNFLLNMNKYNFYLFLLSINPLFFNMLQIIYITMFFVIVIVTFYLNTMLDFYYNIKHILQYSATFEYLNQIDNNISQELEDIQMINTLLMVCESCVIYLKEIFCYTKNKLSSHLHILNPNCGLYISHLKTLCDCLNIYLNNLIEKIIENIYFLLNEISITNYLISKIKNYFIITEHLHINNNNNNIDNQQEESCISKIPELNEINKMLENISALPNTKQNVSRSTTSMSELSEINDMLNEMNNIMNFISDVPITQNLIKNILDSDINEIIPRLSSESKNIKHTKKKK